MGELNALDSVILQLKTIMRSIVVYYSNEFKKYETVESRKAYHLYNRAVNKEDTFSSYPTYDPILLLDWGIAKTMEEAVEMGENPREKIPQSMWQLTLSYQRKYIIDNYVEMNEYVRVHIGLPPLGVEGIYASDEFYSSHSLERKMVHQLTDSEVIKLRIFGDLDRLRETYPEFKYLQFLGAERINHHKMKTAWNFEILRIDQGVDPVLLNKFETIYMQNREYVSNILYVNDYSKRYAHYDRFMAMLTLIMTIQRCTVDIFKVGIERDFYDIATLEMFFEQYNVPFIENLPIEYSRLLAKNLNKLLHYKSTDKVLFDISELLGFSNVQIFKYFLVKQHRYDDEGNPIFEYNYETDEEGNTVLKPNLEMMYDIFFQTVDVKDPNPMLAITNPLNREEYHDIVIDDPYWWFEEKELHDIMYETEFNIIETKYLHMTIMFRLTEMMFEVIHFFRMLIDRKDETRGISIQLPKIASHYRLSYFETAILMITLICKRNNMKGEIIAEPSKVMSVLGFNFAADFDYIRQLLVENEKIIDSDTIAKYIVEVELNTKEDIEKLYANIRDLWDFLTRRMGKAKNIREYEVYEKIYRTLHVSQDMAEVFTKSDGQIASTYLDFLEDINPQLSLIVESATKDEISVYIDHLTYRLQDEIKELKHLHIINDGAGVMVEALEKMIRFFKSYTVDLRHFNIIYLLDSRYYNMVRLIDDIEKLSVDITLADEHLLHEMVHSASYYIDLYFADKLTYKERFELIAKILLKVNINMNSDFFISALSQYNDGMNLEGKLFVSSQIKKSHDMKFDYSKFIDVEKVTKSYMDYVHKLTMATKTNISTKAQLLDDTLIDSFLKENDEILLRDSVSLLISNTVKSKVTVDEQLSADVQAIIHSKMSTRGVVTVMQDIHARHGFSMKGRTIVDFIKGVNDSLHTYSKSIVDTKTSLSNRQYYFDDTIHHTSLVVKDDKDQPTKGRSGLNTRQTISITYDGV